LIVSGIWWKRVEGSLKAIASAPLLLLLGGCGVEQLLFSRPPAPEPPNPLPPVRPSGSKVDVSAGLAPLPTPQQVLTAVPFGRPDPFAPLPAPATPVPAAAGGSPAAGARAGAAANAASTSSGAPPASGAATAAAGPPARLLPPDGFRLTGVIRSGGRAEALVSYGAFSGSLRPGDRGGRSTDLLPAGWALAAIEFGGRSPQDPPSITLKRGPQKVQVSL
jgi:hypothetical protein